MSPALFRTTCDYLPILATYLARLIAKPTLALTAKANSSSCDPECSQVELLTSDARADLCGLALAHEVDLVDVRRLEAGPPRDVFLRCRDGWLWRCSNRASGCLTPC